MSERWRYRCIDCGSVSLTPRVTLGGYRCQECGAVMDENERIDTKIGEANA